MYDERYERIEKSQSGMILKKSMKTDCCTCTATVPREQVDVIGFNALI